MAARRPVTLLVFLCAQVPEFGRNLFDQVQANPDLYRRSLDNNRASFSPDGLMPPGAPAVVWQAIARFDPALAAAKIDIPATYQNTFAERAARAESDYAGNPLISMIFEFIRTAKRPLTMAVHRADLGDSA